MVVPQKSGAGCKVKMPHSWIRSILLNSPIEVSQEAFHALMGVYIWQSSLLRLDMHWARGPSLFNVTLRVLMAWWLQGMNSRNLWKELLLYMNKPLTFKTKNCLLHVYLLYSLPWSCTLYLLCLILLVNVREVLHILVLIGVAAQIKNVSFE